MHECIYYLQVIHYHFWLKRHEILRQCEDWIAEMEQHSSDKRTGRSIAHSTLALKVCTLNFWPAFTIACRILFVDMGSK